MDKEPIRVLQVLGIVAGGGVESVIMNYYRHIDHSRIQFDFVVHNDNHIDITAEVESMGGRVYKVTPYTKNPIAFMKEIYHILKTNHYKIIHSNMNTLSALSLVSAYFARTPIRILHNHSTSVPGEWKRNLLKYIFRPIAKLFANKYWACGKLAAEWMYGKQLVKDGSVTLINNAISVSDFSFDVQRRYKFRKQIGISDQQFVIGHVGRFVYVKNQSFIIELFSIFHRLHPDSILLFIGDGPLRQELEKQVQRLGISENVRFCGIQTKVSDWYHMMDLFLLPSFSEGFPVVGIEAQANGLPIIVSDVVTTELKMTYLIQYKSLSDETYDWVKAIEVIYNNRSEYHPNMLAYMSQVGFNIYDEAFKLCMKYEQLVEALSNE